MIKSHENYCAKAHGLIKYLSFLGVLTVKFVGTKRLSENKSLSITLQF